MDKKHKFQSICADYSESKTHVFDINGDSGYDCHNTCVVWNYITFYGTSFDLMDDRMSSIYQGDYRDAVKIGDVSGCLILCKQLLDVGEDPLVVCRDIDAGLGYAISALSDEDDGPLSMDSGDPSLDVYYIRELKMEAGYDDPMLKSRIIAELPGLVFTFCHVAPDLLSFYPSSSGGHEILSGPPPALSVSYHPIFGQQLKLDKTGEEKVYQHSAPTYLDQEYGLFERHGFKAVPGTGVLYKYVSRP